MNLDRVATNGKICVNVGCGKWVLDGWINCDIQRSPLARRDPEILCDVREIPLPDNHADVVMAIHLFEHFYPWECVALLTEWRRILKPGGQLVLEMPNLVKCCKNIIEGKVVVGKHPDQMGMWGLFGDPTTKDQYMMHKWGWGPKELGKFLRQHGFDQVREERPQWHHAGRDIRDMRIVALKV